MTYEEPTLGPMDGFSDEYRANAPHGTNFPEINNITRAEAEMELMLYAESFANDPYGFVMNFFPWGQEGTDLADMTEPEEWQIEFLKSIGEDMSPDVVVQKATAAGHGVGKSALVAMIVCWGLSTRVDTRIVITANTENQLTSKTWPEVQKWHRMLLCKHWFNWTATQLMSVDKEHERSWNAAIIPWSESRPESFQGLHNKGKRAIVIFDEASAIPDVIFESIEGAFTDANTERLWLLFGNPTRNLGRFKDCFDRQAQFWNTRQIDSRTVRFTDKVKIDQWLTLHGEDSDFFRVRVRGMFPRAGSRQFIGSDLVSAATTREAVSDLTDPMVIGVDVARYGTNESVIYPRKGYDARSYPIQRFSGLSTMELASQVVEAVNHLGADAVFIDETGVGAGVRDRVEQLLADSGVMIIGVNFSGPSTNTHFDGTPIKYANKRAEIYGRMKQWLRWGAIPNDRKLIDQLTTIEYSYNPRQEILLEPKEKMEDRLKKAGNQDGSPDDADALATTFAEAISMGRGLTGRGSSAIVDSSDFDPFAYQDKEEY